MRDMTTTAMLGVVILLTGAVKVPSPVAGGEFQLSAPLAVLICAYFGFSRYFTAGILASFLGLLLGTSNLFNIAIALVFRLIVGGIIAISSGQSLPLLMLSGPVGTFCARIAVAQLLHLQWQILAVAAIPGMVFTAVVVGLAYKPGLKLLQRYRII